MSAREWKPGDVARIEVATGDAVGVWTGEFWAWTNGHGPYEGVSHCHRGVAAHPVVVIDPEDREAVLRLWRAIEAAPQSDTRPLVDVLRDALREFANPTPPKPDEPQGLGAVVEDADGHRYIRCDLMPNSRWHCATDDTGLLDERYANIAAVRVLSEGVTR